MPAAVLLNADDPIFGFEHMMQHRQYFAVMGRHDVHGNLSQFTVLPYVLDPAIGMDRPAQPWNLKHQQAHNDFNGDLPANSNDGYTITVVTPPDVTGDGYATVTPPATGTQTISIINTSGQFLIGSDISGAGIAPGTFIVSQQSGPPGRDGVYILNQEVPPMAAVPVTITHPPYQQADPIGGFGFGIHPPGILLEGEGQTPEQRSWWTFANHQEHLTANNAILPLPTTAPVGAGTGPGFDPNVSNPWWWATRGPVVFPYW